MRGGTTFELVSLTLDPAGVGRVVIRTSNLAEFKAVSARFYPHAELFDAKGRAHHLALTRDPEQPHEFPSNAYFEVRQLTLDDSVTSRMWFGNNFLQDGIAVHVIRFSPPTENGDEGVLRIECADADEYADLLRFLDEPHGSALRSMEGPMWYVHRISDDGDQDLPFPQKIDVHLSWLRSD